MAPPGLPQRYLDWSVWIAIAVLTVVGAVVYASVRSRIGAEAHGDPDHDEELVEARVAR